MARDAESRLQPDLAALERHVRRVLAASGGSDGAVRITLLKQHRTRCTFEVEWTRGNVRRAVIAKLYLTDRADVYGAMSAIRGAGFGPNEAFSIPEPLAYMPECRLLLLEKVDGLRMKDVLMTGAAAERVQAAEQCGHWLARFHAVAPRQGQAHSADDVLAAIGPWSQAFAATGGALEEKAARLRARLAASARRLAPAEPCASHGHFSCGQLIRSERMVTVDLPIALGLTGVKMIAKQRTVAFDWDGYHVGDPCRDVARFVIDLKRLAWKTPAAADALDAAAAVFLDTYFSDTRRRTAANLPFYAGAVCLRLACRDILTGARDKAEATLDEGLRVVERALSPGRRP